MTLFGKPISEISEDDLNFLISQEFMEGKKIEYKNELPGDTSSEKKEFLYDVTAFANTEGGTIFFGIDENEGKPIAINGLDGIIVDKEKLRLEDIIRYGVSPNIPNLIIRSIKLSNSNDLLFLQIPNSWSSPHMVSFNHSGKFYARNSAGKYQMDIHEIKQAFLLSETIIENIRSFREKRINEIIEGVTPINLDNSAKVILHAIPLVSFKAFGHVDITRVLENFMQLKPMGGRPIGTNFNLDGIYSFLELNKPERNAYAQMYRNGIIETTSNLLTKIMGDGSKKIMGIFFEDEVIASLGNFLQLYEKLGIEVPIVVFLSLANIRDYTMGINYISPTLRNMYESPIDRDNILLPELLFDSFSTEDLPNKLKQLFDIIWNSSGWPNSMNYNEAGIWQGN